MLHTIRDSLLALAFPQSCHVCGGRSVETAADGVACRRCWQKTRLFSDAETRCTKCAAFLRAAPPPPEPVFCHRCDPHFYDAARAVGRYEHALAASVLYLKREPFVPPTLAALFVEAFEKSPFRDAVTRLVPVPLSKKRRRARGFNQAEVLAALLARSTGLALDRQSLGRRLDTPFHRAGMDRRARELTVENAFEVTRPKLVENRTILLVDDVFTSGATASYCARILKKHGAAGVYMLTLARAA